MHGSSKSPGIFRRIKTRHGSDPPVPSQRDGRTSRKGENLRIAVHCALPPEGAATPAPPAVRRDLAAGLIEDSVGTAADCLGLPERCDSKLPVLPVPGHIHRRKERNPGRFPVLAPVPQARKGQE